jgi:hypothetical protein
MKADYNICQISKTIRANSMTLYQVYLQTCHHFRYRNNDISLSKYEAFIISLKFILLKFLILHILRLEKLSIDNRNISISLLQNNLQYIMWLLNSGYSDITIPIISRKIILKKVFYQIWNYIALKTHLLFFKKLSNQIFDYILLIYIFYVKCYI